jgi:Rrf2 family protein
MLGLLNISEAMSIALHTCASLAEDPEQYHSARQISEKLGFSAHHFAKVAQQLVRAGLLATERGPSGGAKLARAPEKITLLEIYTAAGGTPRYQGCLLKHDICKGDGCALGKLMAKENDRLVALLDTVTLDSVVRSLKRNRAVAKPRQTGTTVEHR